MRRSICLAELPSAGLGNMLLVWARGVVFSHLNAFAFASRGWSRPRIGPILRGERSWRLYRNMLRDSDAGLFEVLTARMLSARIVEPEVARVESSEAATLYVFNKIPEWRSYFSSFRDHRLYVRRRLLESLAAPHREALGRADPPAIGVHVRCGDFRPLKPGENFARVGLVRTPIEYFVRQIRRIREVHGGELPATVFSDGNDDELRELLALPGVRRAQRAPDIVEMLTLAKSRIVVCSAGSTFSYWGGFLADAPMLLHPDHVFEPIRDAATNARYFEGGITPEADWPALLAANVRAIPGGRPGG